VSAVRDGVRSAIAALSFLTAIPVGRSTAIAPGHLRRGAFLFPLVGALVGGLSALVAWVGTFVLPSLAAGALGVATGAVLTAAIHLDALADTADGIGAALAGEDPEPAMSDPRLGSFGATALAIDLLIKGSVLGVLAAEGFPLGALAAGALGRASILALALTVPYAETSDGTGTWTRSPDRTLYLIGLVLAAAIGVLSAGIRYPAMLVTATIVCVLVARWSARHLGGMRGDTFGAAAELTETLALTAGLAAT
jgi:adenosylcobinamide-GDP ribazoletransferase